ncbi:hypothetical protein HY251_09425 [bacterium]|nr:hypothetical protein [bacterium]
MTDERTGKTIDLLLTTKLSPLSIVRGKILAAFVYGLLFIVATVPIVALTFLYGGVTPGQIALTYGVMIVLAGIVTVFGVAVSTVGGSTFQAVFRTYAGCLILIFPLTTPLSTTQPLAGVWSGAEPGKMGYLSGILAIHVIGPLSKTTKLIELRDELRTLDSMQVFLYWAAHAAFYASLVGFFLVFARNRLAPISENRARPMRLWFLGTLTAGLTVALSAFLQVGLDSSLSSALVTMQTIVFLFFVFAAMAFGGEDPVLPRKLRARAASLRGARSFWKLLEPGARNGARFVLAAAIFSQLSMAGTFLFMAQVSATALRPEELDRLLRMVAWGSAWFLAFVFFLVELAKLLAWVLRHVAASALSILCLVIVLMLYPSLWYAFDDMTAPASIYKGYVLSPVATLRSLDEPPSDQNRRLIMFGPSGADLLVVKQAFHACFEDFMQKAHDEKAAVARGDALLQRARLGSAEREAVRRHATEAFARLQKNVRWPDWSRPGIFFEKSSLTPAQEAALKEWTRVRDDSTNEVIHELARGGVSVHAVSTFVFLALGLALLSVNRKGLARLSAQVAKAEGAV